MKTARVLAAGVLMALLIGGQSALADRWSLGNLVPFGKKELKKPPRDTAKRASPLEKLNADIQKLSTHAKRFLAGAKGALTWKKPAQKGRPTNQYIPWIREPKPQRHVRRQKDQKKSWLSSLFRREEPKRVESLNEWMGLPRLDP